MKKNTDKGPIRINEILPQVLARYGVAQTLDRDELEQAWSDAIAPFVPESLRSELVPGNVRRGTLCIKAKNTALVQELSFHESEIVAKLNETLPARKIQKIRYTL